MVLAWRSTLRARVESVMIFAADTGNKQHPPFLFIEKLHQVVFYLWKLACCQVSDVH
jgi:hypothetical protein